ncbi:MAG: hypothetical protein AB7H92_16830 [Microbacteriaceae bacterium]
MSKVIVAGTKVSPSVLAHDAARTGVLSQQTDQDADPRRPSSLFEAAADADHGAPLAGSCTGEWHTRPSFLRRLPNTFITGAGSLRAAVREKAPRVIHG